MLNGLAEGFPLPPDVLTAETRLLFSASLSRDVLER